MTLGMSILRSLRRQNLYDGNRSGFFLFPGDPKGNNIRVFSISSAVEKAFQI